jgi:hypothetical protein
LYIGVNLMDQKKKIIIQEIEYWKRSRLLPEHYCDFLLQLYLSDSKKNTKSGGGSFSFFTSKNTLFIIMALFFILGFLAFYFIDFSNQMQMYLIAITVFIFYSSAMFAYRKGQSFFHYLFSIGCMIMLLGVVRFFYLWGIEDAGMKISLLLGVCLIWVITGIIFRIFYLQFIGLIAIVGMTGWGTISYFQSPFSWIVLEGAWAMSALLFFTISLGSKRKYTKFSFNLYLNGIIIVFVPSVQATYISSASTDVLQLFLFAKVILLSVFLYLSRESLTSFIFRFSKDQMKM